MAVYGTFEQHDQVTNEPLVERSHTYKYIVVNLYILSKVRMLKVIIQMLTSMMLFLILIKSNKEYNDASNVNNVPPELSC